MHSKQKVLYFIDAKAKEYLLISKKYYPIGIDQGEGRGIYFEYSGIKVLEKIVVENIHDNKNIQERYPDHKMIPFAFGQTIIKGKNHL